MIECGNCGAHLDDDGSVMPDENAAWCDDCEDNTPHEGSECMRCGHVTADESF